MKNIKNFFTHEKEAENNIANYIITELPSLNLDKGSSLDQIIGRIRELITSSSYDNEDRKGRKLNQALDVTGDENIFDNAKLKENKAKLVEGGSTSANQGILVKGKGNKGEGIEIIGNLIDEQNRETKNYAIIVVKDDDKKYFTIMVDYKDDNGIITINSISRHPSNNWKKKFSPNEKIAKGAMEAFRKSVLKEKDQHVDDENYLTDDEKEQINFGIREELDINEEAVISIVYLSNKVQEEESKEQVIQVQVGPK